MRFRNVAPGLSVLLSLYYGDDPEFLHFAMGSLEEQTVTANEIVIVKDGPLTESLERVALSFEPRLPIRSVQLVRNAGRGLALQKAVPECHFPLVAIMDADDICAPDRFEKQLRYLEAHDEVDAVGGWIAEFDHDPDIVNSVRRVPLGGEDLMKWARKRNPLNQMTVMFRKHAVLAAGNYQHMPGFEDYYLWVRMLLAGSKLANLDDVLVFARCGNGMQARRGGLRYAREEIRFQLTLAKIGFISSRECAMNILARTPVRLAPPSLRGKLYSRVLRDKPRRIKTLRIS
jgi:glycosyltransferase involved in cell wall biosynthesis